MTTKRATAMMWASLMLCASSAVGAVDSSLPVRISELIRDDRATEAIEIIDRDLAALPADAPPLRRCQLLHQWQLVTLFEFKSRANDRERSVAAAQCWSSLPGAEAEALAKLWPLRDANSDLRAGRVKEGIAATNALRAEFERVAAKLPPMERALGLDALATAAYWSSQYDEAVRHYRNAVEILEAGGTIEKVLQAELFAQLAESLERAGQTGEALVAAEHALTLVAPPKRAPRMDRIRILSILGSIEYQAERWDTALTHADMAIALLRPLGESGLPLLNYNLMRRSHALSASGRVDDAIAPMREAIAQERAYKPFNAPRLASRLGNLANLQMESGDLPGAEASLNESVALYRSSLGTDNERLLGAEFGLASLALHRRQFDAATQRINELIERATKQFGADSERLAEMLRVRGRIAFAKGKYADAEADQRRALELLPAHAGVRSSDRFRLTRERARSLHALGRDDEAYASAVAAERQRQRLLREFGSHLGGAHAVALQREMGGTLDMVLALTAAKPTAERIREAWSLQIGARQPIANLVAARIRAARASADAKTTTLWRAYEAASEQYASAAISAGADAALIAQRRDAMDAAERALANEVAAVENARADLDLDSAELAGLLPAQTALAAFVLIEDDPWQMRLTRNAAKSGRYYAFTLSPKQAPRLVDLGPSAAIDAAAASWQRVLRDPDSKASVLQTAGSAVRKLVLDPLQLPEVKRWMAIPAGELFRISWLPLPLVRGSMLESGPLPHLLDSERDLRASSALRATRSAGLMLVGAPTITANERGDAACTTQALPGAADEIATVAALWRKTMPDAGLQSLTGTQADEAAVRTAMQKHQSLHFATHSVTASGACPQLLASRAVQLVDTGTNSRPKNSESGALLLSATRSAPAPAGGKHYDGLLTPTEVATLDLSGAQNVVLSACDSGSGAITPEEGVFGLRRAFRLAGARSVVMSLWPIDDAATSAQMQAFYRRRLHAHEDVVDALAGAARETLAARRAAGQSVHPYYWAAFVASGDWR